MEYQPISEMAQLGALEDLLRVLLHFILLSDIVACCLLLALCLGDLLPPRGERRSSPGRRRGASEAPGPKPDEAGLDLAALNRMLAPPEEATGVARRPQPRRRRSDHGREHQGGPASTPDAPAVALEAEANPAAAPLK